MKKIILLLAFISITLNANAQESDLIVGNWVFTEALNEGIDEEGLAYIESEVIGKWKFNFKSDGKFDTSMKGQKANGTWSFDANSNAIKISSAEGSSREFKILKSTESELVLKLGFGEFLLTRVE